MANNVLIIWEAVRVYHDMTIQEAKDAPQELHRTYASKIVLTDKYVYCKHPHEEIGRGSWTIIPYSLVRSVKRLDK